MEGLVTWAQQQPLLTGRASVLCHSPAHYRAQLCPLGPPARTPKALGFQLWPKSAPPGKHLPLPVPLQPQSHSAPHPPSPPAPSGTRWLTDLSQAPSAIYPPKSWCCHNRMQRRIFPPAYYSAVLRIKATCVCSLCRKSAMYRTMWRRKFKSVIASGSLAYAPVYFPCTFLCIFDIIMHAENYSPISSQKRYLI